MISFLGTVGTRLRTFFVSVQNIGNTVLDNTNHFVAKASQDKRVSGETLYYEFQTLNNNYINSC